MEEKGPIVTVEDLPALKAAYTEAKDKGVESFTHKLMCGEEGELLTSYAKYLIEYLEIIYLKKYDTEI